MTGVWPTTDLVVYFGVVLPCDCERIHRIWRLALSLIEGVCAVTFREVDSDTQAENLWTSAKSIDGAGNKVAVTEEPTPGITASNRLFQWIDSADIPWMSDHEMLIMFLHEHGHFLGREHSAPGVSSVMSEYLDITLDGLTTYDISELQHMYGAPEEAALAPQLTTAVRTVVAKVEGLLSHLPGDIAGNVDRGQLVSTVATAVQQNKTLGEVLQAVIAAAPLIFPGALYLQLAVRLLGLIVELLEAAPAANAA